MRIRLLLSGLMISCFLVGSAFATTVEWQFYNTYGGSGNTNIGTSASYMDTTATYGVTAYGYDGGSAANILENNRGNNEQGLGISGNGYPEINKNEVLMIDLGSNYLQMTNWKINFNSVDGAEKALLFVLNDGTIGNHNFSLLTPELMVTAGGTNSWLSFDASAQYLYVMENWAAGTQDNSYADDVLVKGLQAQIAPVPEPGTLLLLGAGLVGFAVVRRRQQLK